MSTEAVDYVAAVSIGAACGAIDRTFVGSADKGYSNTQSPLGALSDEGYSALVRSFARLNDWSPSKGGEGDTLSAIAHIEAKFNVAYDHNRADRVNHAVPLTPSNHHYYQPGHYPDLLGLVSAIADELDGKATFFKDGKIVRVDATPLFANAPLPVRIALISCRWFCHLISDVAGSSKSGNRGMGLPVPLMNCLQKYDFTHLDLSKLNQVLEKAYLNGYDLRFATATAVPVVVEETLVRVLWVLRQHCKFGRPLEECAKELLPTKAPSELKYLLLSANASLCLVDLADAAVQSNPKNDPVGFASRLNYAAWLRLSMLAISSVSEELGEQFELAMNHIAEEAANRLDESEQAKVDAYRERMLALIKTRAEWSNEAISLLEAEHNDYLLIACSLANRNLDEASRADNSIILANASGADAISNTDELDAFMA